MSERCDFCWSKFKSLKYLEHHQRSAKYCQNYKYVMFTCRKCNFSTRGIKNIDAHAKSCNSVVAVDNPVAELEKRISELEEENTAYKAKLTMTKESLTKGEELSTLLRLEYFKNKIYRHIISQNTSILIDDVLVEKEDGIHVYNVKGGSIPVFVHENVKGEEGLAITQNLIPIKETVHLARRSTPKKPIIQKPKKVQLPPEIEEVEVKVRVEVEVDADAEKAKPKKQSYRSIKTRLDLVAEPSDEDIAVKMDLVDAEFEDQVEQFGDLEQAQKAFTQCFSTLKQSRIYTKVLGELRAERWKIFGRMSLAAYQQLLTEHIQIAEDIFRDKNYPMKKSVSIISKGLSPLESRIVAYGNYTGSHLEIDEIQRLETVLDLSALRDKEYVPFVNEKLCENFYNYGAVLFPIRSIITRYMFNCYGFNNVVYLPLPKSSEDDPYSFYVLERVNKEKRYWKMDCRLEDFSTNIVVRVLPYMVSMFRKLYRDVFGDNEFRADYMNKCQLTEGDCEQLLHNILLLGQPKEFCNAMRNLVRKEASYTPTENDKFNLYGDDALQRKRFQEKEEIDLVEIIKQIFDGITSVEAVDFYRNRTT